MTELHGIDVSHWQTGLDLRHTDAEFVICKATEGTSYVDPQCGVFADQARDLGIPFGVYHFYEGGGTAEADHFIRHVSGWVGRALLALDFETHTADVAGARAWLDRVHHQTGVRPVLYISASVLTAQNWAGVAAAGYGLWLARWADGPGPVAPWDELTLWQYTDHHKTGGMQVDADRFYGDRAAWSALAAGSTQPEEDDMPYSDWPDKDKKALANDVVDALLKRDLYGDDPDKDVSVGRALRQSERAATEALTEP